MAKQNYVYQLQYLACYLSNYGLSIVQKYQLSYEQT